MSPGTLTVCPEREMASPYRAVATVDSVITYIRAEKGQPKRPVSIRRNPATGEEEYCFGLNIWRSSVKRAWRDFQQASTMRDAPADATTGQDER